MPRKLEPGFDATYSMFERLEDVDHEVAARAVGGEGLDLDRRIGFARRRGRRRPAAAARWRGGLRG